MGEIGNAKGNALEYPNRAVHAFNKATGNAMVEEVSQFLSAKLSRCHKRNQDASDQVFGHQRSTCVE
jgi:hypothetical protein